jgi:hypothetical protein
MNDLERTRAAGLPIAIRRLARPLLVASLIALHATVMLCGPCLHGLAGSNHGAAFSRGTGAGHTSAPIKASPCRPDVCPVCHFFSQAQLPIHVAGVPVAQPFGPLKTEAPYDAWVPTCPLTTSPRAPPAGASNLS